MAADNNIYEYRDKLSRPALFALALHGLLLAAAVFVPVLLHLSHGSDWGDQSAVSGEAVSATMVSSIPLPANPNATNVMATDSTGVTESEAPRAETVTPDAIKIPERDAKLKKQDAKSVTRTVTPPVQRPPQPKPVQDNRVPFGEGGPVSGPYGVFSSNNAKGGIGLMGGATGSINGYYVRIIREKISENWYKYQVGASVSGVKRVYIKFDIRRDGTPSNIQMEQSSGVPSLDNSAKQAIQRIDTFGPLPNDYRGSYVSVEFWFDLGR